MSRRTYDCLSNNEECVSKGYNYKIVNEKQCFDSLEDCRKKGFKTLNNECLEECPENTYEKNNDNICYCSFFFYKDFQTNLYECLLETEICEEKDHDYKIVNEKQCFDSLEDCRRKGFKTFNNECYSTCPENTNEKNNDGICYFIIII